jgi:hypothetical protein
MKTMIGSSLSPVVCRRAHVLFTLFVLCLFAHSGVQHMLCCFLSSYCVPCVASFPGLSILYCSFGIPICKDTIRTASFLVSLYDIVM